MEAVCQNVSENQGDADLLNRSPDGDRRLGDSAKQENQYHTVCKITRNDAEHRIQAMTANSWRVFGPAAAAFADADDTTAASDTDLEEAIPDAIAKYIIRKFKGYKMENLIEEILKAKGLTVYHSRQGADGGKDLLACGGEMGFGKPRICVQVKTQDTPVDRPTLDQLGGVMNNMNAEYGLLVSWNGFKDSVAREEGNQFFKIRLWDSSDVIREFTITQNVWRGMCFHNALCPGERNG